MIPAGRPVHCAGSELVVLVFEQNATNSDCRFLKEFIRAAPSDFEARRLFRQSARH
jgi:hypothetical protein